MERIIIPAFVMFSLKTFSFSSDLIDAYDKDFRAVLTFETSIGINEYIFNHKDYVKILANTFIKFLTALSEEKRDGFIAPAQKIISFLKERKGKKSIFLQMMIVNAITKYDLDGKEKKYVEEALSDHVANFEALKSTFLEELSSHSKDELMRYVERAIMLFCSITIYCDLCDLNQTIFFSENYEPVLEDAKFFYLQLYSLRLAIVKIWRYFDSKKIDLKTDLSIEIKNAYTNALITFNKWDNGLNRIGKCLIDLRSTTKNVDKVAKIKIGLENNCFKEKDGPYFKEIAEYIKNIIDDKRKLTDTALFDLSTICDRLHLIEYAEEINKYLELDKRLLLTKTSSRDITDINGGVSIEETNVIVIDSTEEEINIIRKAFENQKTLKNLINRKNKHKNIDIAQFCFTVFLPKKGVLFKQGDNQDKGHAYLVIEGSIGLEVSGEEILAYKPGDFFGDFTLFLKKPFRRTGAAIAKEDAKIVVINREKFNLEAKRDPKFLKHIIRRYRAIIKIGNRKISETFKYDDDSDGRKNSTKEVLHSGRKALDEASYYFDRKAEVNKLLNRLSTEKISNRKMIELIKVDPGQFCKDGDKSKDILIVLYGTIWAFLGSKMVNEFFSGDIMGELNLFPTKGEEILRTADLIVSDGGAVILRIPRPVFEKAVRNSFSYMRKIIRKQIAIITNNNELNCGSH